MRDRIREKAERIKYFFRVEFKPWVKKNKKPLIISAAAITVIIISLVCRPHKVKKPPKEKTVKTEQVEGAISGRELKKLLFAWKPEDRNAIVVAEGAQLAYHYKDAYQSNESLVMFVDGKNAVAAQIQTNTDKTLDLWGVNYGNLLKEKAVPDEAEYIYAREGLRKKATNRYTVNYGIRIPDDEYFIKKSIMNGKYKEVGSLYYPVKIILPQ